MSTQKGNSGFLVVKSSDFKDHTDGSSSRHDGYDIDLVPNININSNNCDNVYKAIDSLNTYVSSVVTDATSSNKGVIKLTNDLAGTADAPIVSKITGTSNQLNIDTRSLVFSGVNASNDIEIKYSSGSRTPKSISITSQSSTGLGNINPGGDISLSTGLKNSLASTSRDGKFSFNVGSTNLITLKHLTSTSRVISLFKDATTSDIPGEANGTLYIADTVSDPTQNPVNGTHLYSKSGKVRVYNSNGDNFNIGDTPSNWKSGSTNNGTQYTTFTSTTTSATTTTMATFTIPTNNSVIMIEADIVGKSFSTTGTVAYKLIAHFYSNGSTNATQVGATTISYSSTNNAVGWTAPSITTSSSNILVKSGGNSGTIISWSVYVKAVIRSV